MYFLSITTLVDPSQCGSSYGLYNVTPAATSAALGNCGTSGTETCSFSATSLEEAIGICDDDSAKCLAFAYSELSQNMIFIDPAAVIEAATTTNIYRRNVNPVRINGS